MRECDWIIDHSDKSPSSEVKEEDEEDEEIEVRDNDDDGETPIKKVLHPSLSILHSIDYFQIHLEGKNRVSRQSSVSEKRADR